MIQELPFNTMGDERGFLIAFEENNNVPFDIKRVFYIFGTQNYVVRGNHANRKTKFLLISISGSCKVKTNDGTVEKIHTLKNPETGLFLDKMVWKEMYDFSDDCILLVMASEYYDPNEYIKDYAEFLKVIKNVQD